MAKIKIEDVLHHLDYDMKRALEDTVRKHIPNATVDRNVLYRTFLKEVYRKCRSWEEVPDRYVEK
ncbi:hypothetical protein BMI91_10380 [Thioclava sediminum]|uniref:Transposase n=1 Tax=Thioclava sediminum TaxID=1915319 RepID=A0ABX3N1W7_9RHOB|nr:hypothetical protein BMI91_10380 [Thioclava sediminum]